MSDKKALVKNAADPNQVKQAKIMSKINTNKRADDIKFVLSTEQGCRFVWDILSKCKTFGTIWHSSALIHYNAGQQDIGHWLMAEIVKADETLLAKLMKDNYKQGDINV